MWCISQNSILYIISNLNAFFRGKLSLYVCVLLSNVLYKVWFWSYNWVKNNIINKTFLMYIKWFSFVFETDYLLSKSNRFIYPPQITSTYQFNNCQTRPFHFTIRTSKTHQMWTTPDRVTLTHTHSYPHRPIHTIEFILHTHTHARERRAFYACARDGNPRGNAPLSRRPSP